MTKPLSLNTRASKNLVNLISDAKEKRIYKNFLKQDLKAAFKDLNKSAMYWSMNEFKTRKHKLEDIDCQKTFYLLSTLAKLISDKKSPSKEEIHFIKVFTYFFETEVEIRNRKDFDKKNSQFKITMIKTLNYIQGK